MITPFLDDMFNWIQIMHNTINSFKIYDYVIKQTTCCEDNGVKSLRIHLIGKHCTWDEFNMAKIIMQKAMSGKFWMILSLCIKITSIK